MGGEEPLAIVVALVAPRSTAIGYPAGRIYVISVKPELIGPVGNKLASRCPAHHAQKPRPTPSQRREQCVQQLTLTPDGPPADASKRSGLQRTVIAAWQLAIRTYPAA